MESVPQLHPGRKQRASRRASMSELKSRDCLRVAGGSRQGRDAKGASETRPYRDGWPGRAFRRGSSRALTNRLRRGRLHWESFPLLWAHESVA
jgi:hypothetical protein